MNSVPRVLVTDPEQRAALAAVRAYGRRGWHVETIGVRRGLAGVSRYVSGHHEVMAEGANDPGRYREDVRRAVVRSRADVVVPVTDAASRMLLGSEAEIGTVIAGPTAQAYARASDKGALLMAAEQIGLRVPRQVVLESRASSLEPTRRFGEVVVKPARSVVEVNGRTVRVGVRFCSEGQTLASVADRYPVEAYPLLIQERIVGEGVGVFLLRTRGVTVLRFGHRRLREKPPAGGVSTYRESWEPPPALIAQCEALLDALEYDGAAMIEFKRDARTGDAVLMEINARLWGSVQLAIDAGVDFPSVLVQAALGLPLPEWSAPRTGVRSVWELGELDHALVIGRRSAAQLDLPRGTPTGWGAALRALLDHRWGDHPEVFRFSDPKPFVSELGRWLLRR